MSKTIGYYIVLTFKEWTNWVEYGFLRKSQRMSIYTGTQESFNNLFDVVPDITHLEDHEFVFAKIVDDYYKYICDDNYISLDVVQAFYAVSQRGKHLLASTADKIQVSLNVCNEIEVQWSYWCKEQKDILLNKKAISFFTILFFDEIKTVNELNEKISVHDKKNAY